MESIRHDGIPYAVREVARPDGWSCRLLATDDEAAHFLEYLVSVGPYKVDVARIRKLDPEQVRAWRAGTLRLGEFARQLAEAAELDEGTP